MSDWEDMVNKVCVTGRPARVNDLALDWQAVFYNARTVSQSLRDGLKDLQEKWKGPAADEYRKKIESIAATIEKIEDDNKGIIQMLQDTSKALATGQTDMPVPDYMLDEVQGRRAQLDAANDAGARALTGSALAVSTFGLSYAAAALAPDSFMKPLADSFVGNWGRELFGHFQAWWDDWDGKMTDQAKAVYDAVDQSYGQADLMTPDSTPANPALQNTNAPLTFGPGPGSTGLGKTPGLGSGSFNPDASKFDPNAAGIHTPDVGAGSGPGAGTGGFDPSGGSGGLPGYGSGDLPTSSLAGAGGGGLGGLGSGGGGLGSPGGGLGAGGLSSGALGSAGRPVSPPAMPMGMGGGAGAGRGAAGRTAGAMGGGHGAGGHAPEDERGTWLTEDDDVWGGDSDAPPSVLS